MCRLNPDPMAKRRVKTRWGKAVRNKRDYWDPGGLTPANG